MMEPGSPGEARLDKIANQVRRCVRCPLHKGRTRAVPGEGPGNAALVLVGEAPGREEDLRGRPFVGPAGRLLDQMLEAAGIGRDGIYITSLVKCRPPGNRIPRRQEIDTCVAAYLRRQLEVIEPRIVCLLGVTAIKTFLGERRVSSVRGRIVRMDRDYFPTYHPAAARRNPTLAELLRSDLVQLGRLLE